MSSCVVFALAVATSQTNPNPPKPLIIQMNYGLAGPLFTGRATGWPFRQGHWNWLTATVYNPLNRDLDAALTFHSVTPQATGQFGVTKEFCLPGQSSRRVSFPVRSSPPRVHTLDPSYGVMQLKVAGEVTDEKRAVITFVDENIYAIGVLGDSNGLTGALDAATLYPSRGPELQSLGVVRAVVLDDDQMPENPLGLDFLHALVIIHPSRHELRPGQWAAIDEWVQAGGNLVFVVGGDPSAYEVPDVWRMLPAYPVGTRRVTILPSLADWSGESLSFDSGVVLAEMVPVSGRVLTREGDIPLVVQSRRGCGRVSCVALNVEPGLSDLTAYKQFWVEVFRHLHQPPAIDVARLEPFANSFIEQFAGRRVVGLWLPIAIIAAYFTVIWLFIRRSKGRGVAEIRWIGVCATAIAFTGTSYALVWATSPTTTSDVFDIWIARGTSPSHSLAVADYLSMLPATRGESTVHVKNRQVQVVPTPEPGATVVDSSVHYRGPSVRYQAEKARIRTLELDGQVALPGLSARATARADALVVELENQSSYDLDKAFFKLGRRVVPVGPMARHERKSIDIGLASGPDVVDRYESDQILDSSGRLRHTILRTLIVDPSLQSDEEFLAKTYRGVEQGTSSDSFFAGWINRPLLDVSWSQPERATTSHALGLVAIEPEWEIGETRFLVPRGGMTMRLPERGVMQFYFGRSAFRGDQPASSSLSIEFVVPPWAQPAEIEQATLFLKFSAQAYRLVVNLGNARLSLPEVPSGRFPLPASALASRDARAIKFQLVVEPTTEFADERVRQGHRWTLREFEVECLCRRLPKEND